VNGFWVDENLNLQIIIEIRLIDKKKGFGYRPNPRFRSNLGSVYINVVGQKRYPLLSF